MWERITEQETSMILAISVSVIFKFIVKTGKNLPKELF